MPSNWPLKKPTCLWTEDDDEGIWHTSCGAAWTFEDGGPKDNKMNFCMACGRELEEQERDGEKEKTDE